MAVKWAGASLRGELDGSIVHGERLYIDFRQKVYPPITGHDMTFAVHTSGDNHCGSHYLSGGNAYYLLDMPSTFILSIELRPNFAYDVATNQNVCAWYVDADSYWIFRYNATDDKFEVVWFDGTAERELQSRQFDDGVAQEDIDQWMRWDIIFDSTTGDTTGSKLYYNRTADDTAWSGNIDGKVNRFPLFEIRSANGTEGDYKINFIRLFSAVTTDDVANDHKGREEEEIYWCLNDYEAGQTRVNVTRLMEGYFLNKNLGGANTLEVDLQSTNGEFADEQYSAWAPASESFNGLTTQRYLQYRTPVILEYWYSHNPETLFVGRVNDDYYSRTSPVGDKSMVHITAEDAVSDIARCVLQKTQVFEDHDICDTAVETDSLLHDIVRLATKKSIYNYLANSSFENATIGNSWVESGGTFTKDADQLLGTSCGKLDTTGGGVGAQTVKQTVTFTGTKKLNVGETYNFSIYLKSAGAATADIELEEHDVGGENDATTETYTLAGGEGWFKWEVSHTITDGDSDRLNVVINVADNEAIFMDCAMLVQAATAYDWFVLNDNDGAAGVESADDADSASYDTIGFDCDDAAITHPYAVVEEGKSIWAYIKEMAVASLARIYCPDSSGTFCFQPRIDEPADPTSLLTLTTAGGLQSILQVEQANKIIVHGVRIVEATRRTLLWLASASRLFGDDGPIAIALANGETWPDPSTFGELWAKYDTEYKGGGAASLEGGRLK